MRRAIALDLAVLAVLKIAIGAYVVRAGFTHVSDDDYARVVIAEAFAHAPKLDPSGTSWLPFPFWVNGLALMALGRSLAVAKAVAFALGVLSVVPPYLAMRAIGCGRATAIAGVGVAMALPWSAWLGVATVPESLTAGLVAAGAIAMAAPRARVPAAIGLFAAALSRYEAWPACAVMGAGCAWAAWRGAPQGPGDRDARRPRDAIAAGIAMAGPALWMAWNAYAHGSPVHFLARVAAYRQAIGAASAPLGEKLVAFPAAVIETSPLVSGLAAVGAVAVALDGETRRRWAWPLASAGAILVFLVYGDVRDGAPTHHPERAVIPIVWILSAFAADALRTLGRRVAWGHAHREAWLVGIAAAGALAWVATLPARYRDCPAVSASEAREAQIARGLAARDGGETAAAGRAEASGSHLVVTPCAYEHFALIAAFGAPERVEIAPATHAPVTPECPGLELR